MTSSEVPKASSARPLGALKLAAAPMPSTHPAMEPASVATVRSSGLTKRIRCPALSEK